MQDLSKLNSLAEGELAALRLEGIEPTDADVVELNALAWGIECPAVRMALSRGRPVACGNVWLWPLTVAGASWYQDSGCEMDDPTVALAYAMACGRDAFIATATWEDVRGWLKHLTATRDEMMEAVSQVIAQEEQPDMPPKKDAGDGLTMGDMVAALQAIGGGTAEMWERHVSMGHCFAVWSVLMAQIRADGKTAMDDQRLKANVAFGWASQKIRERQAKTCEG